MKNKLVFFGTENFSGPSLQALVEAGYNVVAVVTKPDTSKGRGRKTYPPLVKTIAIERGIKVLQPEDLADFDKTLIKEEAYAGVLVAYGKILPTDILSVFPGGIINLHPSKLPKYRGPSPIESVLLNGQTKTAVSLMKLTKRMDAGPIYYQHEVEISPDEDRLSLYQTLSNIGAEQLSHHLHDILDGKLNPQAQNESEATYTKLIRKKDGLIDWSQPAEQIARQIRAYKGWPGSFTELFDVRVTIQKATTVELQGQPGEHFISNSGLLAIYCGQDALEIETLQPAGKKPMASDDFLRGYAA